MDSEVKTKIGTNLRAAHKMASNWVMGAAALAGGVWMSLMPDQQTAILQHCPIPPWLIPPAISVIGIAARCWPQKSITPAEAEAKSAA